MYTNNHVLDMYAFYEKFGITSPVKDLLRSRAFMHDMKYISSAAVNYSDYKEIIVKGGGICYFKK